jgi:hypothetical protein
VTINKYKYKVTPVNVPSAKEFNAKKTPTKSHTPAMNTKTGNCSFSRHKINQIGREQRLPVQPFLTVCDDTEVVFSRDTVQ